MFKSCEHTTDIDKVKNKRSTRQERSLDFTNIISGIQLHKSYTILKTKCNDFKFPGSAFTNMD